MSNWFTKLSNFNVEGPYGPMELVFTDEGSKLRFRFSFQDEQGYYEYFVTGLSVHRPGYYPAVGRPSYILIQLDSLSEKTPVNDKFISDVIQALSGLKSVPFNAGRNPIMGMLENAVQQGRDEGDWGDDDRSIEEITQDLTTPDPETGRSSISVSPVEGSWSQIYESNPDSITYTIRRIAGVMKKAIQPLMDSGWVEFYNIRDSSIVPEEMVRSEYGQQLYDEAIMNKEKQIGYYKYVISTVLSSYPNLQGLFDRIIRNNGWDDIPVSTERVDLSEANLINSAVDDDTLTKMVHDAMLQFDEYELGRLETLISGANQGGIDLYNTMSRLLYRVANEDNYDEELNGLRSGYFGIWGDSWLSPEVIQVFESAGYGGQMEGLRQAAHEGAMKVVQSGDVRSIKDLLPFYKQLGLPENVNMELEQFSVKLQEQKAEEAFRRQQQQKDSQKIINWDKAVYDLPEGDGFYNVDRYGNLDEYLIANRHDYDWGEAIYYDAYDKAKEEAWQNMPEKPSDIYEQDQKEIVSDIEYESDDFLEDLGYWETEEGGVLDAKLQGRSYREKSKVFSDLVKQKFYPQFVEWKVEKLRAEEEESGEYEGEPDEEDIYRKMEELVEGVAYESGVLFAAMEETRDNTLDFYFHSKYKEGALQLAKDVARLNKGLSRNFIISLYEVDTGQTTDLTVGQLSSGRTASWLGRLTK